MSTPVVLSSAPRPPPTRPHALTTVTEAGSEGFVTVAGVSLAYTLSGAGPNIVLLHGWCCNRRFWREQIAALEKDHRVLALDFRGHGDSEAPAGGYTIARLADDVSDAMAALGVSPATVVGHSMGGIVAQDLVLMHPDQVVGLVLVTTLAADPERNLISRRIARDATCDGFETALVRHFPGWFTPDSDAELMGWTKAEVLRVPAQIALALVADYQDIDYRPRLNEVRVPTLVLSASADTSTPEARSEELATSIPDATLVTVPGSGHFVQLERPTEVNEALRSFLTKHRL